MAMARAASLHAADGRRVLHLEVGQPATPAPEVSRRAVADHLGDPLGYTDAGGLDDLRERLATISGGQPDPSRVFVVAGASAGFSLAFLTLFEPGQRVGVVEPGYPCYRNTLIAMGVEPVPIAVGADTRWAPTPDDLVASGHLDGLILASPSNPTGTVLTTAVLSDLAAHCRAQGIAVIADEIYHGIVADDFDPGDGNIGRAPKLLDHTDDGIVINSFSKYFSMTGWRIGWAVVPDHLADTYERLQQNLYICAPHVSQIAALAALDAGDELDGHVARYRDNRHVVIDGLAAAGIVDIAPADGAFYVYAHVPHLTTGVGLDSVELCRRWLDDLGVATTPGVDFDLRRGHEYVRFSYAGRQDDLREACDLLAGWLP